MVTNPLLNITKEKKMSLDWSCWRCHMTRSRTNYLLKIKKIAFLLFLRTTLLSTVLKACILSITIYTLAQYVLKMRLMKRLAFTFFSESWWTKNAAKQAMGLCEKLFRLTCLTMWHCCPRSSLKCHTSPNPSPWGARRGERRLNSEHYDAVRWRHIVIYTFLHKFRFLNKLAAISHGLVNSNMRMVDVKCFMFWVPWSLMIKPPEWV